ncbi:hypothetical protein GCM10010913_45760 [Paenibacillus aceti]|uniref:Uncharacterized protein n=1 Tax=Paenibacillus aceti TaxID=1820010 RepID=A0ABQ1W8R9_9BACL|nr:hypothetical protein GCM10010913_45760 [Paenibacillus aceti]
MYVACCAARGFALKFANAGFVLLGQPEISGWPISAESSLFEETSLSQVVESTGVSPGALTKLHIVI